jgi:hypothetical protein
MSQASKDSSAVLSTAASSALGGISSALRRGFRYTPSATSTAATRITDVDKIADIILSSINKFATIYNIIMNENSKKSIIDRLATLTPPIHMYCNKDTPDINNISTYYLITSLNFRGIDNDIFKYTRSKLDILAKKIKSENPSAPDVHIVFLQVQSMYIQMLNHLADLCSQNEYEYILSNPPFYEKNGMQVTYKNNIRGFPSQEIRQQPDGTYVLVSISAGNTSTCVLTPLRKVFRTPEDAAASSNDTAAGMLEIPGMLEIKKEYNCNAGTRIGGGRRRLRSRHQKKNRRNTRRRR